MTVLSLAARNYLAQDTKLTALLGRSATFTEWIFDTKPYAKIENSQSALIVVSESGNWQPRNQHNTQKYPRLIVDIWADPTRNPDHSVKIDDADRKIDKIRDVLSTHLHLVNPDVNVDDPDWMGAKRYPHVWGTQSEIFTRFGVIISGSQELSGPELSDVRDSNGARMGRLTYGVSVA